uniref:Uncharacterized protein n=1 Tax=Fagus sylvatica TaxID=28930 RepID=A0A2N9IJX6_FAGSY
MAEGVLFDLAGKVLEVAGSFALQEIKLASGVKAELENLKSTVSTIQAVLLDAEKKASHSVAVKDWLERLKDLFLDADDLLDDFSTEAMQREVMTGNKMKKEVHIFFSSSNQLAYSLKMGHRIKAIRERLNVIENDMTLFDFIESLSEPQVKISDRETYSFVLEEDVVGREDDKKAIIERLFYDNVEENISIIPIVGIGEGFNAARSSCGWCKTKKATSSGGLSELKELSNLGGSLQIKRLGHGKDDMVECKATNMKEKQHLQRLELYWNSEWDGETECYDEESLEGLQPHPNLKALELWGIWHLPPLNKLPFLKSLSMMGMKALEYISEEEDSRFTICPKLTSMPPFPYLKESLELWETSSKVLQQTMKMGTRQRASTATTSTSTSSSSCFPLSQLQSLSLEDVNDLESLPEEWLGNLTSLQRLQIWDCPNLTSLPQGIRNLTSLQKLIIRRCPILGQRCQRQTGEDWPNIAHVPYVEVDGEKQQQETIPSSS